MGWRRAGRDQALPPTYSTTSRPKPEMPCMALGAPITRILRTPEVGRIWAPMP